MKKNPFLYGFVVGALMLGLGSVSAQTQSLYYVRAGAVGAKNGSDWVNAYTTLPTTLVRGATYFVAGGTYGSYTFNTAVAGTALITIKKATVADHGTATGWLDAYDGQAVFDRLTFSTSYWMVDGKVGGGPGNWKGEATPFGFKVAMPASYGADEIVTIRGGVSTVTIRHLEVRGNRNMSGGGGLGNDAFDIALGSRGDVNQIPASNITISYAYVDDIGRCPFWVRVNNMLLEYAYVGRFQAFPYNPSGAHAELISFFPSKDVTIANNVFTHISGTGGVMLDNAGYAAGNFKIYGNVFNLDGDSNDSNGVIGTWGGGSGEVVKGCAIYNNAFINCPSGTLIGFGNINGTTGIDFKNNLVYASPTSIINATHDYNHWVGVSGGNQGEAHGTTGTGNPFRNYTNLDFRLTAITQPGVNLGSPYNVDPLGNPRTTWTRGAYEYGTGNTNPVISISPSGLDFGSITAGATNDLTFTVQNVGGGMLAGTATLSGTATVFQIISGGTYSLGSNQSQTVTVRYTPTATGTDTQSVTFTAGGGATATVTGVALSAVVPLGPPALTLQAESGTITTPFVASGGYIEQTTLTDLTNGGRAAYSFTVTDPGNYIITGMVNAPALTSNSLFVNIDAEPTDPTMTWDILPITSGFERRTCSWRGNGTAEADQITPKVFGLAAGSHTLIVRGREGGTQLQRIEITKVLDSSAPQTKIRLHPPAPAP